MWTMQFLILIAGAYADRSDNIYPQNLAVIVGEPVSFLCGTMSSEKVIIWKVKKIGKLVEELISTGFNVTKAYQSANFSIGQSKTGNNYVLQMNHVELDDAGTYKCILTGSRESVTGIGTAQLVVLGSKPECHASAEVMQEGDYLSISCSIYYSGSLNPVVECSGINESDFKVITNVSGPYSFNVLAMFTKKNISSSDTHRNVTCTTYFQSPTSIDNRTDAQKAYNAPQFKYHWIFQMNVHYRPKSVNIDPRKETYINGEVIRCNADGNPSPSYAWKDIGSNVVASLNSTLVVNVKRMHNRTYECTATNNGGSISTSITFRLDEGISKHGTNLIAGVTIFAGVLFAVLGVVVIAITFKHIAEAWQASLNRQNQTGPKNVLQEEDVHHVNTHTDEYPPVSVVTELTSNDDNRLDDMVLEDDTDKNQEEGDNADHILSDNPLSIQETPSAYAQLGNRSAVLVSPIHVYQSLEDYELIPELQISNADEHEMPVIKKDANAKQCVAKTLYNNIGQVEEVDDYINVGQLFLKNE